MNVLPTAIEGVFVAETQAMADHRGAFSRWFCEHDLAQALGAGTITQINQSRTLAVGAIRGLHFQHAPHAEMKLVRCIRGRVWDVAVDLRAGSPTLLAWHAQELSAENGHMLIIPEGCAHGFQVLQADSELLYLHTAPYTPQAEGGARWDDPRLAIPWPLPATDLSARDQQLPLLSPKFIGITV